MKNILVIAALVLVALYGIIITISYVDINTKKVEMYDQIPVTKDPSQAIAVKGIGERPAGSGLEYRYEIRVQNDYDNERLELTETLDQALTYLKRYSMHHEDLFVYDLSTGMQVASSNNGTGAIYTGAN